MDGTVYPWPGIALAGNDDDRVPSIQACGENHKKLRQNA